MITNEQREALLDYLDFHLTHIVRKYERHLDPAAVHGLYEDVYYLLSDVDNTISTQQIIDGVLNKQS